MIENEGQKIKKSNYWDSEYAKTGKLYLSSNAGAFRLLAPEDMAMDLQRECGLANEALISLGTWPEAGKEKAAEILLEDGSDSPYVLHLSVEQLDRWPDPADDGRQFTFTLWGRGPELLAELPARLRFVPSLPYLRPWGK